MAGQYREHHLKALLYEQVLTLLEPPQKPLTLKRDDSSKNCPLTSRMVTMEKVPLVTMDVRPAKRKAKNPVMNVVGSWLPNLTTTLYTFFEESLEAVKFLSNVKEMADEERKKTVRGDTEKTMKGETIKKRRQSCLHLSPPYLDSSKMLNDQCGFMVMTSKPAFSTIHNISTTHNI
ncbi:hypothetical protein JD844_031971 [Phrynosoma platyrhinos]|uniref:Uncharacterized protein n=1 Tax=Phrynosoma platyrhinos TaxID=52577 RepID=A0ABQ7T4T2_PHRPL|nr:hypothetical protein JD844_031971 [Phrynosoma platyrhinos]